MESGEGACRGIESDSLCFNFYKYLFHGFRESWAAFKSSFQLSYFSLLDKMSPKIRVCLLTQSADRKHRVRHRWVKGRGRQTQVSQMLEFLLLRVPRVQQPFQPVTRTLTNSPEKHSNLPCLCSFLPDYKYRNLPPQKKISQTEIFAAMRLAARLFESISPGARKKKFRQ